METFEDLKQLRDQLKETTRMRHPGGTQIIVGMGDSGIAAGARQVMTEFLDEVVKKDIHDVKIYPADRGDMGDKAVLVDVVLSGQSAVTYRNVTPEQVSKIISEHVMNGRIVEELVVK